MKTTVKYHLQKRSKWWWIVEVDEEGNRLGLDGHKLKSIAKKMAKDGGIKLEKEDLLPSN